MRDVSCIVINSYNQIDEALEKEWDELAATVRDDARLAAHPAEFVAAIRPSIDKDLTEANIKGMFESLGQALTRATRSWRG